MGKSFAGFLLAVAYRRVKLTVLAVLLGVGAGVASAQDAHYWTRQYGPTETLLGGLVVGSAFDLSATFYNPGPSRSPRTRVSPSAWTRSSSRS